MAWTLSSRAYAKINLTLHIRGRFDNGYHDLESLVAFADIGDDIALVSGERLTLTISGPEASDLGTNDDNHILTATRSLLALKPDLRVGHFHLLKRLPVASGIGGGSADAAAALRLLAKLNAIRLDDPILYDAALSTGADVPVCLASQARIMRGIGGDLSEPVILPDLFAVLVNPRIPTPTPDVFKAVGLKSGERSSGSAHERVQHIGSIDDTITCLARHRNEMEAAAIGLVPQIADVKAALQATEPLFLRMSGSGATVFAIYPDCRAAAQAAKVLNQRYRQWWVRPTRISSH